MIFTTPCFVRVENLEERNALIVWCANIGYETNYWKLPAGICYVFTEGDFAGRCGEKALGSLPTTSIDCGTDIELFKALAAMNNKNDREQWFTYGMDWRLCHDVIVTKMVIPSYALYHKATAEEIIEHFKNR